MANSPLVEKSYTFAVGIIKFCRVLQQKKEYVVSKQLLKSGTSIGANIEEATQAQSRSDFISKFSIALKEAYETRYWLRLIRDASLASSAEIEPFLTEIHEIIRILVSSIKTAKSK